MNNMPTPNNHKKRNNQNNPMSPKKAERITIENRKPQRPAHLLVSSNTRKVKLGSIRESIQGGYNLIDSGLLARRWKQEYYER